MEAINQKQKRNLIWEKIKNKIDKYTVISFDIFDTLLLRSCGKPTAVFEVVAERMGINPQAFTKCRIKAEKIARKNINGEITLDDIYESISGEYSELKEKLKKEEKFIEKNIVFPNSKLVKLFRYCVEKKRVILVSDMYLDRDTIEYMLRESGITGFSNLYLSSQYGVKKSNGKLFDIAIKKEKISPTELLHIGDSIKSDFVIPQKKGIGTFLYRSKQKTLGKPYLVNAFIEKTLNTKREYESNEYYYKFGYKYLGPAIYGYVKWLNEQLLERNISKVFFLAREGQFIKKAFDLIKGKEFDEDYLYVSRRSLTVPAVSSVKTVDDFLELRPIYKRVKVSDQIEKVGLYGGFFKEKKWYEKCKDKTFAELSGYDRQEIINDLFNGARKVAAEELPLLLSYLNQEKVYGKFAVVDLGWNGSMQRALADIARKNQIYCEMTGFFLAQRDEYYKNKDYIENYGYLFNYGRVTEKENLLLNSGTCILEFLFTANHGTTIKYRKEGDRIEPIMANYEYERVYDVIELCQNAALDFINDIQKNQLLSESDNYKTYFNNMYRMLNNPDKEVIEKFGDLNYSDMNEVDLYLARKTSIFPINKFIKEFKDSGWKVAFIKRNLGTKHAFKIYSFLRRLFN